MANMPCGEAVSHALAYRLGVELQQFFVGARKFAATAIERHYIASNNRETERETGVPFITDVQDEVTRGGYLLHDFG